MNLALLCPPSNQHALAQRKDRGRHFPLIMYTDKPFHRFHLNLEYTHVHTLPANHGHTFNSLSHPFIITDGLHQCLQMFLPSNLYFLCLPPPPSHISLHLSLGHGKKHITHRRRRESQAELNPKVRDVTIFVHRVRNPASICASELGICTL